MDHETKKLNNEINLMIEAMTDSICGVYKLNLNNENYEELKQLTRNRLEYFKDWATSEFTTRREHERSN